MTWPIVIRHKYFYLQFVDVLLWHFCSLFFSCFSFTLHFTRCFTLYNVNDAVFLPHTWFTAETSILPLHSHAWPYGLRDFRVFCSCACCMPGRINGSNLQETVPSSSHFIGFFRVCGSLCRCCRHYWCWGNVHRIWIIVFLSKSKDVNAHQPVRLSALV